MGRIEIFDGWKVDRDNTGKLDRFSPNASNSNNGFNVNGNSNNAGNVNNNNANNSNGVSPTL